MNGFQFTSYFDAENIDNLFGVPAISSLGDDDGVEFDPPQVDTDLQFISRMLLEEDMEDKVYLLQGDPTIAAAAEKPFLDILSSNGVPISPDGPPLYVESPGSLEQGSYDVGGQLGDPSTQVDENSVDFDGWVEEMYSRDDAGLEDMDPGIDVLLFSYTNNAPFSTSENQSIWQFNKGVEEASKFLPDSSQLVIDVTSNGEYYGNPHSGYGMHESERGNDQVAVGESRRAKNQHDDVPDLEDGRRRKQPANFLEDDVPKELYDEMLLCRTDQNGRLATGVVKSLREEDGGKAIGSLSKVGNGGKPKGRIQSRKEVVDLRSLLILCAQSISADDRLSTTQQLKQIRQHSSTTGDGSQRLAHYFADGLEARLAGIGSEIYRSRVARRTSAADILKAFRVYIKACPFKKISHVFANQITLRIARKATRIHIVDFGIGFGFHMPCIIQKISKRPSGTPRLRITGIDFPQPGFRPSERLEETGRRLAEYAREFDVPFEYQPIAKKWESIRIEDLNLREDELLVVTCMHQLENLADETVSVGCPRDVVLNNIRKMKPAVFIHGTINGAYSSPFFATRFREALFYFSAIFDAFDCIIDREDPHRLMLEREFLGQEVLNVVACEGTERFHRPETYKQWQVRNQRCGFVQLPLDAGVMKVCEDMSMSLYNKDFVLDTDGKWMVQGWKGRLLYAVSAWKPASS